MGDDKRQQALFARNALIYYQLSNSAGISRDSLEDTHLYEQGELIARRKETPGRLERQAREDESSQVQPESTFIPKVKPSDPVDVLVQDILDLKGKVRIDVSYTERGSQTGEFDVTANYKVEGLGTRELYVGHYDNSRQVSEEAQIDCVRALTSRFPNAQIEGSTIIVETGNVGSSGYDHIRAKGITQRFKFSESTVRSLRNVLNRLDSLGTPIPKGYRKMNKAELERTYVSVRDMVDRDYFADPTNGPLPTDRD